MYELCLYNMKKKESFIEKYDSPYLLNKRLNRLKYSKIIKCLYLKTNY